MNGNQDGTAADYANDNAYTARDAVEKLAKVVKGLQADLVCLSSRVVTCEEKIHKLDPDAAVGEWKEPHR